MKTQSSQFVEPREQTSVVPWHGYLLLLRETQFGLAHEVMEDLCK